jgi:hypothetical protein
MAPSCVPWHKSVKEISYNGKNQKLGEPPPPTWGQPPSAVRASAARQLALACGTDLKWMPRPGGAPDSSPAIYRWETKGTVTRPVGTSETLSGGGVQACLRHAHRLVRSHPPVNWRATVSGPYGTSGSKQRARFELGSEVDCRVPEGRLIVARRFNAGFATREIPVP